MNKSTISIVVPAYNVEKYIGEALQSIKYQTRAPDELIVIDDGSTDRTLEVIKSFEFDFPTKIISIENKGQGNARNIGARLTSSEYIYYFDSDDTLNKDFIKKIKLEIIKNNLPDIVLFSGESFNDEEYGGKRWMDYSRSFSGFFQNRVTFLDTALKSRGLFCSPCLYVSKKSLWNEGGIQFGANYLEDEAIFFPLLFICKTYYVLDETLFYRRNREGSTMTIQPTIKHVVGALNCVETTISLYQSTGYSKKEYWHIKKRLGNQITSYIYMSRKSGEKISHLKIFNCLFIIRSFSTTLKCFIYMLDINDIEVVQRLRALINTHRKNDYIA